MAQQRNPKPRSSDPVISVAGPASVDMSIHDPPRGWIGDVGRDIYTTDTLFSLKAPVSLCLGGNGGASAYVLGKSGLRVRLNAPIGNDPAGNLVRGWLKEVNVACIAPPASATMLAITATDSQHKRLGCLQYPGPTIDWSLSCSDHDSTWFLAAIHAKVSVAELHVVGQVLCESHRRGCMTVLDTGVGWMEVVEPEQIRVLWSKVDLLIGTVEELGHWTSCEAPQDIAESVLNGGVAQVVIKMGADGAAYQSADQPFTHEPAYPVRRSGLSIGAGDTFNGALIAALARGEPLSVSVTQAQRAAAKVVEAGRGVLGWGETCEASV